MAMQRISKILTQQSKLKRLRKPLEAAYICKIADSLADDRYDAVSFKNGLLTVGISSNLAAANLQVESSKIIALINQKIGENKVKRLRFKMSNN